MGIPLSVGGTAPRLAGAMGGVRDMGVMRDMGSLSHGGEHHVKVMVCGARYLRDADNVFMGRMDSYCAFEVFGRPQTKRRTQSMRGTQNPQWNHEAGIQGLMEGDSLRFAVYDSADGGHTGHDELLGEVVLKNSDFMA